MIAPGCIVILSPLIVGMIFGYRSTAGLLAGIIVSGVQIAFSASNTGGAWDNCKKHITGGNFKLVKRDPQTGEIMKGADGEVQKEDCTANNKHPGYKAIKEAAVIGDTVGDPLKDTSGPSINILVKLSAITSLVFGTFIAQYGGRLFEK